MGLLVNLLKYCCLSAALIVVLASLMVCFLLDLNFFKSGSMVYMMNNLISKDDFISTNFKTMIRKDPFDRVFAKIIDMIQSHHLPFIFVFFCEVTIDLGTSKKR